MTDINRKRQLVDLFRETGSAHHQAYIETDGQDPEWPLWYADYLHEPIGRLLDTEFTKSQLVYLLVRAEKEHQDMDPTAGWAEYYARLFLDRDS